MPSQITNVFVSYNHADASLVAPIVKLLRVNKSLVFQDIDSIQPGKRWRSEIANGLAESHLVVVFWCEHASRSDEVSKEWKAAIEHGKDLLPLLLDATPLLPELVEFQWIDFRGTVGANHSSTDARAYARAYDPPVSPPVAPAPRAALKSARWLSVAGLAAAFATAVALLARKVSLSSPTPAAGGGPVRPGAGASPIVHVEPFEFVLGILLLMGFVFAASACFTWLTRRRSEREKSMAKPLPSEIERSIASELEAEILRRTASRRDDGA